MSSRKFIKTVIQVEVLSEDPFNPEDLKEVHDAITEGDCSGKWEIVSKETLDAKQCALALEKQGSDPGFFQLDSEGNDIE